MDCIKVGGLILTLRREKGLTQKELADAMNLSDRTISKWERGKGCPDVSLLGELSAILGVNIEKLLLGELAPNDLNGGNMKRVQFYQCPDCASVLCSTGEAEISCCGRKLSPLAARQEDEQHQISVDEMDGDYYVTLRHDMSKRHYLTFAAYVTCDRVLLVRLYPEQAAEVRFPRTPGGDLYLCCNQHGLFQKKNLK